MRKLTLCTVLIIIGLQGALFAQTKNHNTLLDRTKTQRVFEPCTDWNIRFRDIVELKYGSKMILDINQTSDYNYFRPMDSLLIRFKDAISFYQDSLNNLGTAHVRIDFVIDENSDTRKIRFKKYAADGDSYLSNGSGNKVSMLKLESDTVRLIILKKVTVHKSFYEPRAIQATFILNNYSDINNIIAEQAVIQQAIDTLRQTKQARLHYADTSGGRNWFATTMYKPYQIGDKKYLPRFHIYLGILNNDLDFYTKKRNDYLTLDFNIGVGLIRNTIAPCADIGIQIVRSFKKYNLDGYNYFGAYLSPYFLFEKNANGDYITNTNVFLNAQFGGDGGAEPMGLKTSKFDIGLGYLVVSKGNYFKNTTIKAYMNFKLFQSVTISPELIATDNFKQIFPGITLKVF